MIPRVHFDRELTVGSDITLSDAQRHYLCTVLRLAPGEALLVFNARDGEYAARLDHVSKNAATVRLIERTPRVERPTDLWLLFAGVKRAAVEMIVQKATELGSARLVPVLTARTHRERINRERLAAIAIEAAEQCLRLSAPDIADPRPLEALLDGWDAARRLIFCDEAGDETDALWGGEVGRAEPALPALTRLGHAPAAILIGPEGGFTPDERRRLRALPFVAPVTLGPRILRADTAAIVALTLWQAAQGDLNQT